LALLISGGHTELVLMREVGKYEIVGKTRDDAVGECFDKTARILGLPYPGGPEISKLAEQARRENLKLLPRESASDPHSSAFALPRPMLHSKDFDFSFSGLKTSVLYAIHPHTNSDSTLNISSKNVSKIGVGASKKLSPDDIKKYAREIEEAITDVITSKVEKAIEEYSVESLIIGGGVIANTFIRSALQKVADSFDIPLYLPHISHSTDNALMIALAGYFNLKSKHSKNFGAEGNQSISSLD
ncbi:MAG TPA: hypothetical protein VMR73_02085, partial [Candidatus Paceibacterota bacterium]|nr:hypothetical protein [Candidatus Paceibacterota bacterium]